MARIKLSGIITGISGKLDGAIFGTNQNGNYVKSNSYSQQKPSTLQRQKRSSIGIVSQVWRSMDATQQASYTAQISNYPYTNKVGDTSYYTAYQLFGLINQNRYNIGLPPLTTCPSFVASSQVSAEWVVVQSNSMRIRALENSTSRTIIIEATPPLSNYNTPNESAWKQVYQWSGFAINDLINFTSAYQDVFGGHPSDRVYNFRLKTITEANGIPSVHYNYLQIYLAI